MCVCVCVCVYKYDLTATFSVFSYQENTYTEHEICTLLGYYAAYNCNSLRRFWDNLLAQGPIGCPRTSARSYHYMLHNNPEECNLIYFVAEAWICLTLDMFIRRPQIFQVMNWVEVIIMCSGKYDIRVIIARRVSWAGRVTHMRGTKNAFKILAGEPEGKKPHGRPRHRWNVNSKCGVKDLCCESMDWIQLSQNKNQWWTVLSPVVRDC